MISQFTQSSPTVAGALKRRDSGFTLIELIVVIIILGILSAIAIPAFLGQQNSAKDASMQTDVYNLKVAEFGYAETHNGELTDDMTQLTNYGATTSPSGIPPTVMLSSDGTSFCVSGKSDSGTWFAATDTLGVAAGYCGTNAVFRNYQPSFA